MSILIHCIFICLCIFSKPIIFAKSIVLGIGSSTKLGISPNKNIYLENSKIVSVKDKENSLLLTGLSIGQTKARIGQNSIDIQVLEKNDFSSYQIISQYLKDTPFLELDTKAPCLDLKGTLLVLEDWHKLAKLFQHKKIRPTQACNVPYRFDANLDSNLGDINKVLTEIYSPFAITQLQILNAHPLSIEIELGPIDESTKQKLKEVSANYGISIDIIQNSYPSSENLIYEIELLLVKKDQAQKTGILTPTEYSYNFTSKMSSDELVAKLNLLANSGSSKSILKTSIHTTPDKEAIFHSGGELPIKVSSQYSSSLSWKKYGFLLMIKSVLDKKNRQHLKLNLELSSIDLSVSIDDVPGLKTYSLNTSANISNEEAIILTGFLEDIKGQNQEGLLWLSQIPIFKNIFSKQNDLSSSQELVVIIRPKK